ncbi:serine hydrolase domain-containing protein [Hymenobacter terricola]|uniref:serine hydrolase domain-containing protein n=1 Tax=Hymenobacter terricola TaxID=2819236 RepID=UPI001B3123EE|nr:serine hydrolase domain-containing protein [Hymenobacter terricola]
MRTMLPICLLLNALFVASFEARAQSAATFHTLDGRSLKGPEIDRLVKQLMDTAHIPGLALALLENNKVSYLKAYGYRNLETKAPLETGTSMYAASFSKAVFACLVMQLVQEKRLGLDKPLAQYLPKPLPEYEAYQDLAGDDRWKLLTARQCLTHTTGLPNWRWLAPDKKLRFKFNPGTQYWYSGEGLQILQLVIEAITQKGLLELSATQIFQPLGMAHTSYVWQPAFDANYALGYDEQGQVLGTHKRSKAQAAGSMETTPADYAAFLAGVMQGKLLKPATQAEMTRPQVRIPFKGQFGPMASVVVPDSNRAIRLAYDLGWGTFESPYGHAYFKEGHDDGWENHSVIFQDRKKAILLMSNSSNAEHIFKELLEKLLGDKTTPWQWENYVPY